MGRPRSIAGVFSRIGKLLTMSNVDDDSANSQDWPEERMRVLLLAVTVEGGFIALAVAIGYFTATPPLTKFVWSATGVLEGVMATVPLAGAFYVVMRWPFGPLAGIKRFSEQVLRPMLRSCSVIDFLGIAVLAGLGEEMLFRGAVQGSLQHWMGLWLAVLISSVFFGLMHAVTALYAILAAIIGAFFGMVYWYTDNLLVVAIAHALYDILALLYLMRGPGSQVPLPHQ
jgi:membrane protease YdiL (CAAX protease family)